MKLVQNSDHRFGKVEAVTVTVVRKCLEYGSPY